MTTVSTGTPEPAAIGANDQDLAPGQDVGEYKIERAIGKGGFGTVYGAVHPLIGKRVAIKVLARKFSADPAIVSRFVAEARAVNQIRHRNIIDIFSFGQLSDGRHYYVMEYLDGDGLDRHLKTHGPMPLANALPILRAIARALDAAHAKGIAHRDLKPENIFLAQDTDGDTFPKLLDFGIAKLLTPEDDVRHRTGTGVPLGTPYYMSPEQCRGRDVDHRTDIYSFGIVAYRVLTGTLPFEGDDYVDLLFKQTQEEPPLPSSRNAALPESVDIAIAWMMQKDPAKRPPNVIEGVNALDPTASVTPAISARGSRPSVPPVKVAQPTDALAATITPETLQPSPELGSVKSKTGLVVTIGLAVVVVALVVAGIFWVQHDADDADEGTTIEMRTYGVRPPVEAQPPVTPPPPVEAKPPEAKPPVDKAETKVEEKPAAEVKPPPRRPVRKPAQPTTPPVKTDEKSPGKGDMIQLGSDAFRDSKQ